MQHLSVVTLNTDSKGVNPKACDFSRAVIIVDKQTKADDIPQTIFVLFF